MSKMQCSDARELVSALIDGELTGQVKERAAAHVAGCPACNRLAADYRAIGAQMSSGYEQPPLDLTDKIRKRIAGEATTAWRLQSHTILKQAAVLLLACGLSAFASWYLTERAAMRESLEREIVASHVRSLIQDKPVQIASSERHTVKPWFAGKIDFSPTVKDLGAQGFPLAGARVDYVGGRRVAALVYMRRLHVINVFVWPSPGDGPYEPQVVALNGYNGLMWTAEGMTHWAVSDLNLPELKELQASLR
jgi:anti-sigma factor RsiW